MMNFVAICLVVSSLAAAGVWSPTPEKNVPNNQKEQVIVREGHRVVVVEYDQPGRHNTRVSISPEQEYRIHKPGSYVSDMEEKISSAAEDALKGAKDRMKEASSVLPNLGQGFSSEVHHGPGELVCDAYGKCKHKIASAIGKAKDKMKEAAEVTKEKAKEAKEKVSETAHEEIAYKKEKAYEAKEAVQDALGKAKEGVAEKAHGAKEAVQDAFGTAKQGASQTAQDVKEGAKESMEKAKRTVKEIKDMGKTIEGDVATNVSEQLGHARDSVNEKVKDAKEGTEHAAKRVKAGAGEFFSGLVRYMGVPQTLNIFMGVLNLVGFATAYGMCVWVTFVSSYVLAEALPRQQFGVVQSKIYPVYFRAMAFSIGLALLGHTPLVFSSKAGNFQGFNLLASLLMVLANSMYLEPRATKVMFERMKVEKEEGRGRESLMGETSRETDRAATTTMTTGATTPVPENTEQEAVRSKLVTLSERLKKLNTYSSILNILSLMSLSWHLVYLVQRLC